MHKKLAALLLVLGLGTASVLAQSLIFPSRNDFDAGLNSLGIVSKVAAGDFDGDGNLDAVVSVRTAGQSVSTPTEQEAIRIFLGDGRGLFYTETVINVPLNSFPGEVVTGDFDGDSNLDFAVALEDMDGSVGGNTNPDGGIFVYSGDGAGGATLDQELTAGIVADEFTGLAAGRFNSNDSIDDLVVLNSFDNTFNAFLSSGSGHIVGAAQDPLCTSPVAVALGQMDASPGDDLIIVCDPFTGDPELKTLAGNGAGVFTLRATQPDVTTLNDPRSVTIADLNDDGSNDVAVGNSFADAVGFSGTVTLLRGDGVGGLDDTAFSQNGRGVGDGPSSIAADDVNGDGVLDLIVANVDTEDISVLEGCLDTTGNGFCDSGTPAFSTQPIYTETFFGGGLPPFQAVFGDLDGAGNLDVVAVNSNDFTPTVSTLLGDGAGGDPIQSPERFRPGSEIDTANAITMGDFDGDGCDDFATANSSDDTVSVFRSTKCDAAPGGSPFELLVEIDVSSLGTIPFDLLATDQDNDGDPDLLVLLSPNSSNGTLVAFENLGDHTAAFTPVVNAPTVSVGLQPWTVAVADFTGGGFNDAAVSNLLDDTATILENESTAGNFAGFSVRSTFSTLNGNTPGTCSGSVSGQNDGDCLPMGLATGDIDEDGTQDLVVSAFGGGGGGSLQVFTGTGAGVFTWVNELISLDPVDGTTQISHQVVHTADLDDSGGPPDIVGIGVAPDDYMSIFLNDGASNTTFTPGSTSPFLLPAMDTPPTDAPRNSLVGDLNRDDKPDLAVLGNRSNNLAILLGNGDGTFYDARAEAFGTAAAPSGVGHGDVDGDGLTDFLVVGVKNDDVTVLLSGFNKRSDLDATGRVDGWDLASLSMMYLNNPDLSDPVEFYWDINVDGVIDNIDLSEFFAFAFGQTF